MAAEQAFFGGNKATILIQGSAQDLDAVNLFNAMNVPINNEEGKFSKIINFKNSIGSPLFNLVCKVSKSVENLGSCTLNIHTSKFANIDKVKREALFMVSASDAWEIVPQFVQPKWPENIVFLSINKKLGIVIDNAGQGTQSLRIWFIDKAK